MAVRIVVSGATGRMGRAIGSLAEGREEIELVGGLVRERPAGRGAPPGSAASNGPAGYPRLETPERAAELIAAADVILDVSAPPFLAGVLDAMEAGPGGCALIVGTTGLDQPLLDRLDALAERAPVLVAANFSIGVNLLLALVEEAARRLPADRYDVEIVETHHRGKADAPSGTALALGRSVAAGRGTELPELRRDGRTGHTGARPAGEIGFHAVRGGGVAGDHRVLFLGERERLELAHAAADRSLFAEGALVAARWIAGREPGRYTMRQVLGIG